MLILLAACLSAVLGLTTRGVVAGDGLPCRLLQEHAKVGRQMRHSMQGGAKDVRVHCVVVRNVASAREPAKILRDLGLEEECVSNVGTTGLCHACVLAEELAQECMMTLWRRLAVLKKVRAQVAPCQERCAMHAVCGSSLKEVGSLLGSFSLSWTAEGGANK